jgi:hypothetical protein
MTVDPNLQVTIRMTAQRAFELRYILPLVAEAVGAEPKANDTKAMLEQAVDDINRALPPALRDLVDEDQINELRMDAIVAQQKAGVRPQRRGR